MIGMWTESFTWVGRICSITNEIIAKWDAKQVSVLCRTECRYVVHLSNSSIEISIPNFNCFSGKMWAEINYKLQSWTKGLLVGSIVATGARVRLFSLLMYNTEIYVLWEWLANCLFCLLLLQKSVVLWGGRHKKRAWTMESPAEKRWRLE